MRLALALVVLALGLGAAGCGGGKQVTRTSPPADPGRDAAAAMVGAVRNHDAAGLWALLSTPTQLRLGPTLADFRRRSWPELERTLGHFASRPYRLVVSERVVGPFGVVAIASGCCHAYAFPMRREPGGWKAELAPGRVRIDVLGPQPGSSGHVQQIAFEARGAGEGATAVLYADGVTLLSKEYPGAKSSTVFANLLSPLARGHHNAVAFAARGNSAAARAWTFVAR